MSFENLARGVKEEIWSYLEVEELMRMRRVCLEWKKLIENSRSFELSQKYKEGVRKMEEHFSRKKFYKSWKYTWSLLDNSYHHKVPLQCFYGRLLYPLQLFFSWMNLCLCMRCGDVGICLPIDLIVSLLMFTLGIAGVALFSMIEGLRILFWLIKCNKRKKCEFTTRAVNPSEKKSPPFPLESELSWELESIYVGNVEEQVDRNTALVICLHGGVPFPSEETLQHCKTWFSQEARNYV